MGLFGALKRLSRLGKTLTKIEKGIYIIMVTLDELVADSAAVKQLVDAVTESLVTFQESNKAKDETIAELTQQLADAGTTISPEAQAKIEEADANLDVAWEKLRSVMPTPPEEVPVDPPVEPTTTGA